MKKFLLAMVLFTAAFASCKKDDCPAPPVYMNMAGTTWTGTSNFPGLSLSGLATTFIFNTDGTLGGSVTNGGSNFAVAGSWNLTPNSNVVRMFYTIVSVAGSYTGQATLANNNTRLESGSGTNPTTPTGNMNFVVNKQ
jgi:hypothetical protein